MENKNVSITLSVPEWNAILTVLSKQPYENVVSLIQSINEQAKEQLLPPQVTDAE